MGRHQAKSFIQTEKQPIDGEMFVNCMSDKELISAARTAYLGSGVEGNEEMEVTVGLCA